MRMKMLQVLFSGKISMELEKFKRTMFSLEPEEIFANAYEIDMKVSIYESVLEMSSGMSEEQLQILISFSDILDYLYEMWMQESDSRTRELEACMMGHLTGTVPVYGKMEEVIG